MSMSNTQSPVKHIANTAAVQMTRKYVAECNSLTLQHHIRQFLKCRLKCKRLTLIYSLYACVLSSRMSYGTFRHCDVMQFISTRENHRCCQIKTAVSVWISNVSHLESEKVQLYIG